MKIIQLGNMRKGTPKFSNPQTGRVYSIDGIAPTINTCQGGEREPKVVVKNMKFVCERRMDEGLRTFKDGVVGKQGVTRTVKKAFMTNFEEWNKTIPSFKEDYVLVVLSASKDEEKINKAKEILDIINPGMEIIFRNLSLNVTAHTGPGVIGLGIMKKY